MAGSKLAEQAARVFEEDFNRAISVDPSTQKVTVKDIFALRSIIYAVGKHYFQIAEGGDPEWTEEAHRLDRLFDGADKQGRPLTVPDDLAEQAAGFLTGIITTMNEDVKAGRTEVAEAFYKTYGEFRDSGFALTDREARNGVGTKTRGLREGLRGLDTIDELEAFCQVLEEAGDGFGFSRNGVDVAVQRVRAILAEERQAAQLGDGFSHYLSNEKRGLVKTELTRAFWLMDKDPKVAEDFSGQFSDRWNERVEQKVFGGNGQQPDPQWLAMREEAVRAGKIRENIPDILNLCNKMEAEGKRFFGDSDEYTAMREAAEKVRRLSENMDYSDRDKLQAMDKAMKDLHAKAEKYAEKEVYDKVEKLPDGTEKVTKREKKTATGISRKNTCLALLQLSNVGKFSDVYREDNVADWRLNGSEKKADAKRKRQDLKELIDAEKMENQRKYGGKRKHLHEPSRGQKTAEKKK